MCESSRQSDISPFKGAQCGAAAKPAGETEAGNERRAAVSQRVDSAAPPVASPPPPPPSQTGSPLRARIAISMLKVAPNATASLNPL